MQRLYRPEEGASDGGDPVSRSSLTLGFLAAALLHAGWGPVPAACGAYVITDLGSLPGGGLSSGLAVNASGQVAGWAESPSGSAHAFVSNMRTGNLNDLGTLFGGRFSAATAINNAGVAAGDSDFQVAPFQYQTRAFSGGASGGLKPVTSLTGWTQSHGTGINDANQVAGYAQLADRTTRAFVTTSGGTAQEIGLLFGGRSSLAAGVNSFGVVVGSADDASGTFRVFRSPAPGQMQLFGDLPGGSSQTFGTAINDAGVVAGNATVFGKSRAFRSNADGSLNDLGALPGTDSSQAAAINLRGDVVGSAGLTGSAASRAFLYTDAGGMFDLNSVLGPNAPWFLSTASGINNAGQITGTGQINGVTHAFLLTLTVPPVPEPSSFALALTAVALVGGRAFVRRLGRAE